MRHTGTVGFGVRSLAGALVLAAVAGPAAAIEFRAGQNVTIAEGEVIADDLYVTGEVITINGVVEGDAVMAGREIVFNGSVLGDLIAAGQGVVINGEVGDDVRIAGMALKLGDGSVVADDLIAAGFSLEATAASLVAGSVVFSGFQALLSGEVGERLLGQMAALRIEGELGQGGEVSVDGGESAPPFMQFIPTPVPLPQVPAGLSIAPGAVVGGELVHTSPGAADTAGTERANLVHIQLEEAEAEPTTSDRFVGAARRWMAILVIGLGLLLVAPSWMRQRIERLASRALTAAGWGVAGLVGLPVAALLMAAMVILVAVLFGLVSLDALVAVVIVSGLLGAALAAFAVWLSLAFVAQSIVAGWLGGALRRRFLPSEATTTRDLGGFVLGWLLLAMVSLVPLLGGIVGFAVAILGFGALVAWMLRPLIRMAR